MGNEDIFIRGVGGLCLVFFGYTYYVVAGSIATHAGLRAVDRLDSFDLSCVIGEQLLLSNPSLPEDSKIPAALRLRDDGGLLQAQRIVDRDGLTITAQDLIESQTTTLGNWTRTVSGGRVQINGSVAMLPLWLYPESIAEDGPPGQSPGGSIAVGKRGELPSNDELVESTGAWSTVRFDSAGIDYCDYGASKNNVWFETRTWLAFGVLRLGQAAVVLATTTMLLSCTTAVIAYSDRGGTAVIIAWMLSLFPVVAFYAIGGIGAVLFQEGRGRPWEWELAMHSPQSETAHRSAVTCFYSYIAFAVFAILFFIAGAIALFSIRVDMWQERRREERARERAMGADGGDPLASGAGVMEAEVINPLEPPSKDPDRVLSV